MKGKSIKIKCKKPYGVIVATEGRKYIQHLLLGVGKTLIVSDETVYRLYGNELKKLIQNSGAQVYTFIYPNGENGKTKHVLDKLLILMTELDLTEQDCLVAFGGQAVASLTAFACNVFKGGIPFVYMPTTLMGMINPLYQGVVGVDFLGKRDLLKTENYPIAVVCDPDYLITLPVNYLQDGIAEIIRRAMVGDSELLELMESEQAPFEQMIFSAIRIGKKKANKRIFRFGLDFAQVAEKLAGLKVSYGKLVAFGMVTAFETAMAIGLTKENEERLLSLLKKFSISYDLGVANKNLWQAIIDNAKRKHTFILPKKMGKVKVKELTEDKIKETF